MYVFYEGPDPTTFESLELMAAHELGISRDAVKIFRGGMTDEECRLYRDAPTIFRGVMTATGHRSFTDSEAAEYQYALEAADRDDAAFSDPLTDPADGGGEVVEPPIVAAARSWVHLHFYGEEQPIIRTVLLTSDSSMLHITTEKHHTAFSISSDVVHSVQVDIHSDAFSLVTVWLK